MTSWVILEIPKYYFICLAGASCPVSCSSHNSPCSRDSLPSDTGGLVQLSLTWLQPRGKVESTKKRLWLFWMMWAADNTCEGWWVQVKRSEGYCESLDRGKQGKGRGVSRRGKPEQRGVRGGEQGGKKFNDNTKLLLGNTRADGEALRKILRERMTSPNNGKLNSV